MITGSTSHKLSDKLYYSEKNDNVGMLLISLLSGLVGCDFMVEAVVYELRSPMNY